MSVQQWLATWPLPTVAALFAIWSAIATWLIVKYRRPNIRFRKFNPHDSEEVVRFLVRSFEPDNLTGRLHLQIKANAPLDRVEVVAGPWLESVRYGNSERTTVIVVLNGFPAEGVIGLRVSPDPGTCTLDAPASTSAEEGVEWIVPRSWGPIETPYRWWRAYLFRLAAGIAFGVLMYMFGCAILYRLVRHLFSMRPGLVDLLLLSSLLPATLVVFALAVPRQGKDTFTGAIDWELSVRPED